MGLQHREDHGQPAGLPAHHGAARCAESGGHHKRLQFHQHRAGTLKTGEHSGARTAEIALGEKQF